ncbi:MAG: flagellar hook-length control protein FliK [Deferribacterales bacterium]
MENLSILKLFSSSVKTDTAKNAGSSSSASSALSSFSAGADSESAFEDVFRSYLDKTDASSGIQMAESRQTAAKIEKQVKSELSKTDTADSSDTENTLGSIASGEDNSQKTAETPEEVIDGLDVSDEVKENLKKMLAEMETSDDVDAFVQELLASMQAAGMTVDQVETALTEMAASLLDGTSEIVSPAVTSAVVEKVLDSIVQLQNTQKNPEALFVMPEEAEESTLQQKLTVINQIREDNETEEVKLDAELHSSRPDELKNAEAEAADEQTAPEKIVKAEAEPVEVKTADASETETAADDNVIELAVKKTDTNTKSDSQTSDFTARTPFTEKVITAEIKIEKPQDIMKFAELVEIAKNQNATKINIQLNPADLGRVSIELTDNAGKITGKVTFESDTAKNIFAANIDSFKQQLAEKGITVENLEFLFKDFDQHQFAGWDNKQNKNGGSSDGTVAGISADEESGSEANDDSVIYA